MRYVVLAAACIPLTGCLTDDQIALQSHYNCLRETESGPGAHLYETCLERQKAIGEFWRGRGQARKAAVASDDRREQEGETIDAPRARSHQR